MMNGRLGEEALKRISLGTFDESWPKAGQVWRHANGGTYDVIGVALREEDLTPLVVYRSRSLGYLWARPPEVFLARFVPVDSTSGG